MYEHYDFSQRGSTVQKPKPDKSYKLNRRVVERRDLREIFKMLQRIRPDLRSIPYIKTDPNVTPVVHPPRKVPAALRDRIQAKLNDMENKGIITKVNEPTAWVNSMVVKERRSGELPTTSQQSLITGTLPVTHTARNHKQINGSKILQQT